MFQIKKACKNSKKGNVINPDIELHLQITNAFYHNIIFK